MSIETGGSKDLTTLIYFGGIEMLSDKLRRCFPIKDQLVVFVAKVFLVFQCVASPVVLQSLLVVVFEAIPLFTPVEGGIFLME